MGVRSKHLITASLAAQRPASRCGSSRQYASSSAVKDFARNPTPERRTAVAMRSTERASTPTLSTRWAIDSQGVAEILPTVDRSLIQALFDCNRLGQVPRLVDVLAELHSQVIGEELEGNRGQHGAARLVRRRDLDDVGRQAVEALVALADDRKHGGVAGDDLVHVADHLVLG